MSKQRSFNEYHHSESAMLMSTTMCNAGYIGVYQWSSPTIESAMLYALWLNMQTGKMVMAIVSPQGSIDYYNLIHNQELKPTHSYSDEELAKMRKWSSGLLGTTMEDAKEPTK